MKRKYLLGCILAAGFTSGAAQAAVSTYDLLNNTAWKLQTTVVRSDDFNDGTLTNAGVDAGTVNQLIGANPGYVAITSTNYAGLGASGLPSPSGITYTAANGSSFIVDSAYKEGTAEFVIGGMDNAYVAYAGGSVTITLAGSSYNSFGVDLLNSGPWTTGSTGANYTVSLNGGALGTFNYTGGTTTTGLLGNPTGSFFGAITDSGSITSVTISTTAAKWSLDNVKFGNVSITPDRKSVV